MTDTTDIKALRESAESIMNLLENLAGYEPQDIDMDAVELRFEGENGFDTGCDISIVDTTQQAADVIRALLDQLEAKRQRAEAICRDIRIQANDLKSAQTVNKVLQAELAALKGEQVPVAIDAGIIRDANRYRFLRDEDSWGEDSDSWDVETRTGLIGSENLMELRLDHFDAAIDARMAASDIPFLNPVTAPQKPVVLPKIRDSKYWGGVEFRCDKYQLDVQAAIEAAGGIVKDGESATITCWSCKKTMTLAQHSSNDGLCPHCNVEIDLEE